MSLDSKNATSGKPSSPIFIMGCPRSGTTLVSQILNSHSRIAIYHELRYYPIFRSDLHLYGDLRQSSNMRRLIADFREAIWWDREDPPQIEDFYKALVAPTFESVLTIFLDLYARRQGKVRGGDKTPRHYIYLAESSSDFPTAL
jgi:hypothetical protein